MKLLAYFATLALVFAGAALAGSRIDIHPGQADASEPKMGMAMAPQAVRGLAVSEGGLTLALAHRIARPGRQFALAFRIADRRGSTVRDFDVEHTKRMHLIVVRRDMTGFQHLHPTQQADGSWTVPATLGDPGSYRVFADFSVAGKPHTLADDLTVDGTVRSHALPAPARSVDVDGLRVTKSGLDFTVTHDGRPVEIADYLGAKGHLVALREGDLAFLHVHPDANRLRFEAHFPTPGRYRLFLQFKTADGRLHTAAFTEEVTR
jgi:hypothetical protein